MFSGVHGIGKTETAIKLNGRLPEYLYVPSFAGPVAKRMGFDLNQNPTPDQVLEYQNRLLEVFIESYKATSQINTIYDRSPIDLIAYIKAALDGKISSMEYAGFISKCLQATKEYCDVLVYPTADLNVIPGDKYNRPNMTQGLYNRVEFDKLIDYYVHAVSDSIKVIDIPIEHQFDDRVTYILGNLDCQKNTLSRIDY